MKVAFLHGEVKDKHKMNMRVPQGFKKWYIAGVYLLLLKPIYGTKQAASRCWILLISVFAKLSFQRSTADPFMIYKWTEQNGLVVWLCWVDDGLCTGNDSGVRETKEQFKKHFEVDDVGPLEEYMGCKIDYD